MGYLFLIVASILGIIKGYCGKRVSTRISKTTDAIFSNLFRMLLCSAIGVISIIISDGFLTFNIGYTGLIISILSGISNAAFVVSWLFAVKYGAYMMVDVFLSLGLSVPIALCAIIFNEKIDWNHYLGFVLLIVSVIILCSYNNNIKGKLTPKLTILLLLCSLSSGFSSFSQKWFVKYSGGNLVSSFNFYTYLVASLVLFICYVLSNKEKQKQENSFKIKSVIAYIFVMSVALFFNSYLLTLAASILPAIVLYPLSTGLSLTLSAAMSSVVYKEKLSTKCIIGIILAFISLTIINLL